MATRITNSTSIATQRRASGAKRAIAIGTTNDAMNDTTSRSRGVEVVNSTLVTGSVFEADTTAMRNRTGSANSTASPTFHHQPGSGCATSARTTRSGLKAE